MPFCMRRYKLIDQSTAEVLNKALDLAKQGVIAGVEMVKQAAPYVWSLALRQTLLNGVECTLGAVACAVACLFLPRLWRWGLAHDDDGAIILPVFVTAGLTVGLVACTLNAIDLIGNPGYWTIMKLLEMAGKK